MRKQIETNEMIKKTYDLSKAGFSAKQIYESLGISHTTFYKKVELVEALKRGQFELRKKISEAILKNSVDLNNQVTQIFLAKKLRLFDDTFDSMSLRNTDDALKTISKLFKAVSDGSISDDKANQLKSILDSFNKLYEANVLEDRLSKLEDNYENKKL